MRKIERKLKPFIEIQNYGSSTRINVCGLDLSEAICGIRYLVKNKKKYQVRHRPILRLDIDVQEFVEILEKLNADDIEKALDILKPYFHNKELLKKWRSML